MRRVNFSSSPIRIIAAGRRTLTLPLPAQFAGRRAGKDKTGDKQDEDTDGADDLEIIGGEIRDVAEQNDVILLNPSITKEKTREIGRDF